MKKLEKLLIVVWVISVCVLLLLVGYYYGHYMNPLYKTRFVPVERSIHCDWI